MSTPNVGLPTIPQNALQISVPYNEAMQKLDSLVQLTPLTKGTTAPPATTVDNLGMSWIVPAAGATGEWATKANQIALCTGPELWVYFEPQLGWYAHVRDENIRYRFTGAVWEPDTAVIGSGVPDAPGDGKIYGRKNNTWAEVSTGGGGGGGIPEAPEDGKLYARQDAAWVEVVFPDPPVWAPPAVVTDATTAVLATPSNAGKYTRFTNAAAKTYTFDGAANVFVAGAEYHGRNAGAGNLTLAGTGGVTLNAPAGGTLVVPNGGTFTVKMISATVGDVIGYTVAA